MLGLVGVLSLAFAQGGGEGLVIPEDLSSLFSAPHSLAAFVVGLVAFLRKHFLKTLDGLPVALLSLALSLALAFFGHLREYLQGDWFWFGLMAGVEASGLVALFRSLLGKRSGDAPATTKEAQGGGEDVAKAPATDDSDPDRARLL